MDITMTATIRPALVEQTLSSFRDKLFGGDFEDCRLIVNVDPVGEENARQKDVVDVANRYFRNVVPIIPKTPNFPLALRAVWTRATSPFVLHLEDDWEMLRDGAIEEMMRIMREHAELAQLRISAFTATETECGASKARRAPTWKLCDTAYYTWDRMPKVIWSNNPCLIRMEWLVRALPRLGVQGSSERYFNRLWRSKDPIVEKMKTGIYGHPGPPMIRDTGRAWRKGRGIRKNARWSFTHWESVK